MNLHVACLTSVALLLASTAHSRTWYVRPDGTGDAPTIQAAIDAAEPGDEVLLAPGTYTWTNQGASGSSMITMKSGVWLHSEAGPDVTVLDAEKQGRVIFCYGVDSRSTIEGLTLTGGEIEASGGGIYCEESSPTITGNVIDGNSGWDLYYYGGGGITCIGNSTPLISNNVISSNGSCIGGGIYCGPGSGPTILRNVIRDNCAVICGWPEGEGEGSDAKRMTRGSSLTWSWAGGIRCCRSSPAIRENLIEGNGADFGAGIACWRSSASIQFNVIRENYGMNGAAILCSEGETMISHNTIVGNLAIDGGAVACEYVTSLWVWNNIIADTKRIGYCSSGMAFSCWQECTAYIECNVLWNNVGGDGECGDLGESNLHADPLFCDPESGDFSLRADSPCAYGNVPGSCAGRIGAADVGCDAAPVVRTSWGRIKALYRR